jgi:hypothetical protein
LLFQHLSVKFAPLAEKGEIMFEVIVTCRPDFREEIVDRCPTLEEAQVAAGRLSNRQQFIRVWIRRVLSMPTNCTKS